MRIDLVITELDVGGAEKCLTELAIGLKERGHSSRVISIATLPTETPSNLLAQRLNDADVPVQGLDANSIWDASAASRGLRYYFKTDRPDVVQTFLFHANVIGTYAAYCEDIDHRVGGIRVAEPKRMRLFLERQAVKQMHGLIAVSKSVSEFSRDHLLPNGAAEDFCTVIPNSVETARFQQATPIDWSDYEIDAPSGVMLFVGRLHHQKGIDWLLRLAPQILEQNPGTALVLIGSGPMQSDVEEAIGRLPQGRAALLPWQSDVAPFIKAAALFLLPSRYEGMPNVILEAMASGLPCVSTKSEGVEELLADNLEVQSVEFDDDASLLNALHRLMSDDELRQQVGTANYQNAHENFSVQRMIDSYERFYLRLQSN